MRIPAIQTDTKEHKGHTITIEWFYDEHIGPPWKEHDGHGPVSEWTRRDKLPGERVLATDHYSKLYYDFAGAVKLAKADGWDAPPYETGTKGERAVRAVEADFRYLQRWVNNDWCWVGYQIRIDGMGYEDSLWGIDSDSIKQFTDECFRTAVEWLDNELVEESDAACRDIATV